VPATPAWVSRPAPQLGAAQTRSGLRVAPVLAHNPLARFAPTRWPSLRCAQPTCSGVPIR
jgi:hypothetical protein